MIVEKSDLNRLSRVLSPFIKKTSLTDESTKLLFTGEFIYVSSDSIEIMIPFETDFSCTVDGFNFIELIKSAKEKVILKEQKNNSLLYKTKNKKASLNFLNKTNKEIKENKAKKIKVDDDFSTALELCSTSDQICIRKNKVLSIEDNQVSEYTLNKSLKDFVISSTNIKSIIKNRIDKISFQDNSIYLYGEDVIFILPTIQDLNPENELDKIWITEKKIIELPKNTLQILEESFIFSETVNEKDEIINFVRVRSNDGKLIISSKNNYGEIETFTKVKSKSSDFSFDIDPLLFQHILKTTRNIKIDLERVQFETDNFKHLIALLI
jgi:hypothetical protein